MQHKLKIRTAYLQNYIRYKHGFFFRCIVVNVMRKGDNNDEDDHDNSSTRLS
jgi:hypothetical protein